MQEYVSMSRNRCQNIMEQIREEDLSRVTHYILPYHAVLKPDSSTTKMRVVFAGSCTTSSSISLNDVTGWLRVLWSRTTWSRFILNLVCTGSALWWIMWSEIAADFVDDRRWQNFQRVPVELSCSQFVVIIERYSKCRLRTMGDPHTSERSKIKLDF